MNSAPKSREETRPLVSSFDRDIVSQDIIPPELEELKGYNNWVLYELYPDKERNGKQHFGKMPYDPKRIKPKYSKGAKANDPATWSDFGTAVQALRDHDTEIWGQYDPDKYPGANDYLQSQGLRHGIGFEFGDSRFCGIDLDNVRDPKTGNLTDDAHKIIERLDSYTEISPSGTGVHIICKGILPKGSRKAELQPGTDIEMYDTGRFFTVTGTVLRHVPVRDAQEAIEAVHSYYMPSSAPVAAEPYSGPVGPEKPDEVVLQEMARSKNGAAIMALYNGDTSAYGNDASRADMALCNELAWFTYHNSQQVDRLFRQSGMYRDKWDVIHDPANKRTYGQMTIDKALAGTDRRELPRTAENPIPIDRKEDQPQEEEVPPLHSLSVADLADHEYVPLEWLIHSILPVYGVIMLAAPPKSYKSFMALDMCLSIASGTPFMGFQTEKNEVLYIDTENVEDGLIERLQLIDPDFRKKKEQYRGCHVITWHPDAPLARIGEGLREQLEGQLREHPALRLIVIDMFSGVKPVTGSAGKGVYMAELLPLEELRDFAFAHDLAVLVVHHNKKKAETDALENISGSSGTTGAVTEALVIQRPDRTTTDATLHITGKRVPAETLGITFDKKTMKWTCLGTEIEIMAEKKRTEFLENPVTQAVMDLMEGEDSMTTTAKELRQDCGLSESAEKIGRFLNQNRDNFAKYCGFIIEDVRTGRTRKKRISRWDTPVPQDEHISA